MRNLLKSAAVVAGLVYAGPTLAQDVIKIGVNQPLTGAVAAQGTYVTQGARIAAEVLNANGGINGSPGQAHH